MNIRNTIEEVLRKRKNKTPGLERVHRGLLELQTQLVKIKQMSARQAVPEGFASIVRSVSTHINDLQGQVSEFEHSVSNVVERFRRDTINIGVAGKARQGKSTLLQKISNLSNREIPTSSDLPCTGAKSEVYHSEDRQQAIVKFYNDDEFLSEIIWAYFERLENLESLKPTSLDEFSRSLPEFVVPANSQNENLLNAVYQDLKRIHDAFPAFRNFLSKPPETISLEKVQEYVTQRDEQGKPRTKYMAVKTAKIYTKFPNHDVTGLCLVDLPGLEAAQGHEKKIVASLEQEVDAVILLKKPSPQGDQWDGDDYKVIDLIKSAVKEIELSNWLFVLLNRLNDGANETIIQILSNDPPKTYKSQPVILTADCTNAAQVDELVFSRVLKHFEENLENIDRQHIRKLAQKMEAILKLLEEVLKPIRIAFNLPEGDDDEFSDLFDEFFDDLSSGLENLVKNQKKVSLSEGFKTKVTEVCKAAEESPPIPTPAELERQCGARGNWAEVLPPYLNQLRTHLTRYLAEHLDTYLKKTVDDALREVLELVFPHSLQNVLQQMGVKDTEDPRTKIIALQTLTDKVRQSNLYAAFGYIIQFNFSYHSLFHYRVRNEMTRLDTFGTDTFELLINNATRDNIPEKAIEINRGLQAFYQQTVYRVSEKLSEMQADPANALFALVEETKDRLARAKDIKKEWRRFLRPIRGQVWPEKFRLLAERENFCKQWQEIIDETLKSAKQVREDFPI